MHIHQFPTGQAREGSEHHFFHMIVEEPETYYEWVQLIEQVRTPATSTRRQRRQAFLVGA